MQCDRKEPGVFSRTRAKDTVVIIVNMVLCRRPIKTARHSDASCL